MLSFKNPIISLGLYLGGMCLIPINDALMKQLSTTISLFEFLFSRAGFMVAVMLLIPSTYIALKQISWFELLQVFARGCLLVIAIGLLFLSISMVPIASAYAVFFTAPMMISVSGILFLGERPTAIRLSAVCLGMLGVLLITQPWSDVFSPWFLVSLAAAIVYSGYQLITRLLPQNVKVATAITGLQLAYLAISVLASLAMWQFGWQNDSSLGLDFLTRNWIAFDQNTWAIIILCAVITLTWTYTTTNAYFHNEASFVAPFEYIALPVSTIWGFFLLSELPNHIGLIGMTIIISAGILMAFDTWEPTNRPSNTQK